MTQTATAVMGDLETRFETAVVEAFKRTTKLAVRRVTVAEQERHTDRMVTCHFTVMGTGWFGSLIMLVPQTGAHWIASLLKGMRPGETLRGPDLADVMGTLGAAVAIEFGRSFDADQKFTVGLPAVLTGNDVAVSFPWGNHFESRMSFHTSPTPFWMILRLCKKDAEE